MEAKPKTELRSLCLTALFNAGFAGPPYNLDNLSAFANQSGNSIVISFYDMKTTISPDNELFDKILPLL